MIVRVITVKFLMIIQYGILLELTGLGNNMVQLVMTLYYQEYVDVLELSA